MAIKFCHLYSFHKNFDLSIIPSTAQAVNKTLTKPIKTILINRKGVCEWPIIFWVTSVKAQK